MDIDDEDTNPDGPLPTSGPATSVDARVGFRQGAEKVQESHMPPTLEAVEAGRYETRQQGDRAEVFIDGEWLTIATAARLGML